MEYVLPHPSQVQRCGVVRFARPFRFGGSPSLAPGVILKLLLPAAAEAEEDGDEADAALFVEPLGRPGPRRFGVGFPPALTAPAAPAPVITPPTVPGAPAADVAAATTVLVRGLRALIGVPPCPFAAAAPPLGAAVCLLAFPLVRPCLPLRCVCRRSCSSSTRLNDVADIPSINCGEGVTTPTPLPPQPSRAVASRCSSVPTASVGLTGLKPTSSRGLRPPLIIPEDM